MSRIASIILILLVISCKKDVNNIPSYVSINSIALSSDATDNITDAWVYIDDNLQGVYELPANFPVLAEGKHSLRVRAGIKDNGIAGTSLSISLEKKGFKTMLITDKKLPCAPKIAAGLIQPISGKFLTSIFHTASMPNSGYSNTSIFLMQSRATLAAVPPIVPR